MKHKNKIDWMIKWCHNNKVRLELEGECGFGRECVGIIASNECYPDYEWNNDDYKRIDNNGDVWCPEDAYHKHPCVAVLGRGEKAELQLYDWIKWFNDNKFTVKVTEKENMPTNHISLLLKGRHDARMVKEQ
jgi:hypothetical protein